MAIGSQILVRGYITKEKYLIGRELGILERYLGFRDGRLAKGATFIRLNRLPLLSEFETAAYSMTAEHRHVTPTGLDMNKLKENARDSWALTGDDRLIKVRPVIQHDRMMSPDIQYPPGDGVPQWKIIGAGIQGTVVAEVLAGMTYIPHL